MQPANLLVKKEIILIFLYQKNLIADICNASVKEMVYR